VAAQGIQVEAARVERICETVAMRLGRDHDARIAGDETIAD